ncbi:MAG: hypothetical protein GY841_01120, partial [FCB group bacterium]|nr:hypothetical protein [FCB group bacterium]
DNIGALPLELDTLYCRWYIFAKSGAEGIPADTSFTIGWPRPVYTGTLAADSTKYGGELRLTWDAPGTPVDSIRVWWHADTIPLDYTFTLPVSQVQYMAPTSIYDTIKGLDNNALYWVGLQVFRDMMWSRVTPASRVSATTAVGDTSMVPNIISYESSWFEDSTNTMVIQWRIDTLQAPGGRTYQA